jgi:cytochrome oxidase Cu insertion factor (SCO1/SenC/PrrC family)
LAALVLAAVLAGPPPSAHAEEAKGGGASKGVSSGSATVRLHDVLLLDQDGRKVRFPGEVIGDRVVVIDTFFTTCTLICPILGAIFSDLQEQLGDRLDREVRLISISVDPLTDIPPRLKKYAEQWEARPGWRFLTGEKKAADRVLEGIGMYSRISRTTLRRSWSGTGGRGSGPGSRGSRRPSSSSPAWRNSSRSGAARPPRGRLRWPDPTGRRSRAGAARPLP